MTARELFAGLDLHYHLQGGLLPDYQITEIAIDAQTVSKKGIFVCIKYGLYNNYGGAMEAYRRGCRVFVSNRGLDLPRNAAVMLAEDTLAVLGTLTSRCLGHPSKKMQVIGITGTHGKSAVALLTGRLLQRAGHCVAVITDEGILTQTGFAATPFSAYNGWDLQCKLQELASTGVTHVIIEFSAFMLKNHAAAGIKFAAVLLTNLSPHHIGPGMHRDFAAYRMAKERLFTDAHCPAYLPWGFEGFQPAGPCFYYGEGGEVAARRVRQEIRNSESGTAFVLCAKGKNIDIFHPVPGDFALHNALAAASLALFFGLAPEDVAAGLCVEKPTGRLECICAGESRIYRDVAYTGEALARCLDVLRKVTPGRLLLVIGAVGGRDAARRRPLGQAATRADLVFFTVDDPDAEHPHRILADLMAGADASLRYVCISDRAAAIRRATETLRPGDTLLICGKALDETQLVWGEKQFFSDKAVALAAQREKRPVTV